MPVIGNFTIKRNDTQPAILGYLSLLPTDVITSVKFWMQATTGILAVNGTAGTIKTQPSATSGGVVKYSWLSTDTSVAGQYRGEFEVTLATGRKETFPNAGYININIVPDLG